MSDEDEVARSFFPPKSTTRLKIMQWRPIETVPKIQGQDVLLWMPGWACGFEGWWSGPEMGWRLARCPIDHVHPTHWMPLPEPPKEG